jgi:hypothetical protein
MLIRRLGLMLLIFSAHFASAEICGLYQFNDYGDRTALTISDFTNMSPQTVNFQISNTESPLVQGLVSGLCYCVEGDVSADPNYPGDYLYKILAVKKVIGSPRTNCHP